MTSSTDPFSASIIPFEVPEQVRAFAEKGVSQARDNYAKFKDVAESHDGSVFACRRAGGGAVVGFRVNGVRNLTPTS